MSTHSSHENNSLCCHDTVYADRPRLCGSNVNKERRWGSRLFCAMCHTVSGARLCIEKETGSEVDQDKSPSLPSLPRSNTAAQGRTIFLTHLTAFLPFSGFLGSDMLLSPSPVSHHMERSGLGTLC